MSSSEDLSQYSVRNWKTSNNRPTSKERVFLREMRRLESEVRNRYHPSRHRDSSSSSSSSSSPGGRLEHRQEKKRPKLPKELEEKETSAKSKNLATTRVHLPMRSTIRPVESTSQRPLPANRRVQEVSRSEAPIDQQRKLREQKLREPRKIKDVSVKKRNPPATQSTSLRRLESEVRRGYHSSHHRDSSSSSSSSSSPGGQLEHRQEKKRPKLPKELEEKERSAMSKNLATTRVHLPMRSTIRPAASTSQRPLPANRTVQEVSRSKAPIDQQRKLREQKLREQRKIRDVSVKKRNPPATSLVQQAKSSSQQSHLLAKSKTLTATRVHLPMRSTIRPVASTSQRPLPANITVQEAPRKEASIDQRGKRHDEKQRQTRAEIYAKYRNPSASRSALPVQQATSSSQQSQSKENRSVHPGHSNNSARSEQNHRSSSSCFTRACPICFYDFLKIETGVMMTECDHIFCKKCILTVPLSREGVLHCPMCRRVINNLRMIDRKSIK